MLPCELKVLKALSGPLLLFLFIYPGYDLVPAFLDKSKVQDSNREHLCYIMKPVQSNLREIFSNYIFLLKVA